MNHVGVKDPFKVQHRQMGSDVTGHDGLMDM